MVGVITSVLAGSAAGLLAGIAAGHSLVAALAVGSSQSERPPSGQLGKANLS
jgi:hypothetical protein